MEHNQLLKDNIALKLFLRNSEFQEILEMITGFRRDDLGDFRSLKKMLLENSEECEKDFSKMPKERIYKVADILSYSLTKINRKMDIYKQIKKEKELDEEIYFDIQRLAKRMHTISSRLVKIWQVL